MKKRFLLMSLVFILVLVVIYMTTPVSYAPEDQLQEPLLATGEICPIYVPTGSVEYNSEWTGEYPAIDLVTDEFQTATFALG